MGLIELLAKERENKYIDTFLWGVYNAARTLVPTSNIFYNRLTGECLNSNNPLRRREAQLYYNSEELMSNLKLKEVPFALATMPAAIAAGVSLIPLDCAVSAYCSLKQYLGNIHKNTTQ